jgi:hypothetical protein
MGEEYEMQIWMDYVWFTLLGTGADGKLLWQSQLIFKLQKYRYVSRIAERLLASQ